MEKTIYCYNCNTANVLEGLPTRQQVCSKCSSYLKCCLNCKFYDEKAYHECKEPQADWVKEKDKSNFCTYFLINEPREKKADRQSDAKKKLDDLFS